MQHFYSYLGYYSAYQKATLTKNNCSLQFNTEIWIDNLHNYNSGPLNCGAYFITVHLFNNVIIHESIFIGSPYLLY